MKTFSQYLATEIVTEDVNQEIARITAEIALVDNQINQRTQPLLQRKAQLQKLLATKQSQQQTNDGAAQRNKPQTITPGSTGAQTPGSPPVR